MRNRLIPLTLVGIIVLGIIIGAIVFQTQKTLTPPDGGQPAPAVTPEPVPVQTDGVTAQSQVPTQQGTPASNPAPDLTVDPNGLSKATVIVTTNKGVIKYKLYPNDAPATVKRMVELVQQGFFNGLVFHRVVPGFVIQGGDPTGTGMGGSGQKLKAEFNKRRHVEGAVAMARAQDPDSADSQFYITLGPQPRLDGSYTVFGLVIEGMDVVKKIQVGDKIEVATIQ